MRFKSLLLLCVLGVFLCVARASQSAEPAPVLFFSDLTSGPATGNSDPTYTMKGGAYVTLYGNFLSPSPAVTLNGASCLAIVSQPAAWMWYQRMVVQLTSSCGTGDLVLTNANGTSNGIPFTTRSGKIRFVSRTGKDTNPGSFASPWATLLKARAAMADGDITYAESGTGATVDDGQGWSSAYTLRSQWCASSTAAQPKALVAYPGASVTIGSTSGGVIGVRVAGPPPCQGGLVFAELTLRGQNAALVVGFGSNNWRFVGNDVSCPRGKGATGCYLHDTSINVRFLGNNVHDVGDSNDNLYHAIYMGGTVTFWEIAWNSISNVQGCRGIQVYSSGANQFFHSLSIHDNTIHNTTCDGIGMYNVSPSLGSAPVAIYNNVIYNAGEGPANPRGGAWTCIRESGSGSETGTIEIFNNTFFDCGDVAAPPYTGSNHAIINQGGSHLVLHLTNNIIYQKDSKTWPYWKNYSSAANGIYGTNNLTYGIGTSAANSYVTRTLNSNPKFVNLTNVGCPRSCPVDLHLAAADSPANGAGIASSVTPFGTNWTSHDHDGRLRPSPPSIGAYEYVVPIGVSKANL